MKVLIFCSTDLGKVSGSQIRAGLIADGLIRIGVQVGVVSAGIPASLAIRCDKVSIFDGSVGWQDLLWKAAEEFQPDVIYVITEALTDIALKVARRNGIFLAVDLHGLGVVEILELGSGHGNRLRRIGDSLRWLSVVPRADLITVANPKLVPVVRPFARQMFDLIGMTDISLFHPQGETRRLGSDGNRVQVLYAGNYLAWQGIDLLMAAIQRLNGAQIPCEFTLVGSMGRSEMFFERWSDVVNEENVHIIETVSFEDVPPLYRGADILVIPRPMMLSTYLAFPQKLVDYLASGRTVVATDLAPHRWALEPSGAGIISQPSPKGIADGIRRALEPKVREECGRRARQLTEERFCHIHQCRRVLSAFSVHAVK